MNNSTFLIKKLISFFSNDELTINLIKKFIFHLICSKVFVNKFMLVFDFKWNLIKLIWLVFIKNIQINVFTLLIDKLRLYLCSEIFMFLCLYFVLEDGVSKFTKFFKIHFDVFIRTSGETLFFVVVDGVSIEFVHVDAFPCAGL